MAYAKKATGKSKAVHTAELTTGQLVLAVCTFLIVLLGVFLLGIIVGEYQYKMRETRQVADAEPASNAGEGTQPGAYSEVKRDRGETGPEPYRAPSDPAASSVIVAAPDPSSVEPAEPATVTQSPLPPPSTDANHQPATPPQVVPPAAVPLEPIEAVEDTLEPIDADTAADAVPIEFLPNDPDAPTHDAVAEVQPATGDKVYSVQVAALSEPKNAESMKKRLEATTAWPVDIVMSPTKKLHIVFVGRFASEAEAEKARAELRKKAEFSESFTSSRVLE